MTRCECSESTAQEASALKEKDGVVLCVFFGKHPLQISKKKLPCLFFSALSGGSISKVSGKQVFVGECNDRKRKRLSGKF